MDIARIQLESGDANQMCRMLEAAIQRDTGYKVKLAVKEHLTFTQLLVSNNLTTSIAIHDSSDLLLRDGNCIPRGVATALGFGHVNQRLMHAAHGAT